MSQERFNVQYPKQDEAGFSYSHIDEGAENEIQIGQIILLVTARWKMLAAVLAIFILAGVAFALSRPNIYEAKAVVIANGGIEGGGGRFAGFQQASSVLALMGGGRAGGNKDIDRALITLKSRAFIVDMVNKSHLMPVIFPEAAQQDLQSEKNIDQAYEYINSSLKVEPDRIEPGYNFSIRHTSPRSAFIILNTVIKALNDEEKKRVVNKARHEMDYVNGQLSGVKVVFLRDVLYSVIAEKAKESTLAEAQEEYVFSVVDPPILPKKKVGPVRTMIVLGFAVVGLLAGIFAAVYPAIKAAAFKGVNVGGGVYQSRDGV